MRLSRRSIATSLLVPGLFGPTVSSARQHGADAGTSAISFPGAEPLLTLLPAGHPDGVLDCSWADIDRQVTALTGSTDSSPQARETAISKSVFVSGPHPLLMLNRLEIYMGFRLTHLSHIASTGQGIETITLLTLNIPVSRLSQVWELAGYERREREQGSFWTIGEEGKISVSNPVQAAVFSFFNNITPLDDYTLAAASTSDLLMDVLDTYVGKAPSMRSELEAVSGGIPLDAVSGWYINGDNLKNSQGFPVSGPALSAESDDAVGPMPAIRTLCCGSTAGASYHEEIQLDSARGYIVLEAAHRGTAEQIAAVVEWRAHHMISQVAEEPFIDLLPDLQVEVVNDHVVRVSAAGRATWSSVLNRGLILGDIGMFAFLPEE